MCSLRPGVAFPRPSHLWCNQTTIIIVKTDTRLEFVSEHQAEGECLSLKSGTALLAELSLLKSIKLRILSINCIFPVVPTLFRSSELFCSTFQVFYTQNPFIHIR